MRPRPLAAACAVLFMASCQANDGGAVTFPSRSPEASPTSSESLVVALVGTFSGPDSWRGDDAFEGAHLGVHLLNRDRSEGSRRSSSSRSTTRAIRARRPSWSRSRPPPSERSASSTRVPRGSAPGGGGVGRGRDPGPAVLRRPLWRRAFEPARLPGVAVVRLGGSADRRLRVARPSLSEDRCPDDRFTVGRGGAPVADGGVGRIGSASGCVRDLPGVAAEPGCATSAASASEGRSARAGGPSHGHGGHHRRPTPARQRLPIHGSRTHRVGPLGPQDPPERPAVAAPGGGIRLLAHLVPHGLDPGSRHHRGG